ncbi:hypothetical protein GGR56DRAFT_154412 [Xylariaceae sp. FL0804]|nr:hypothetical protein GGR56DRAFT_154412 [Xylariaceae sp. FL0804]
MRALAQTMCRTNTASQICQQNLGPATKASDISPCEPTWCTAVLVLALRSVAPSDEAIATLFFHPSSSSSSSSSSSPPDPPSSPALDQLIQGTHLRLAHAAHPHLVRALLRDVLIGAAAWSRDVGLVTRTSSSVANGSSNLDTAAVDETWVWMPSLANPSSTPRVVRDLAEENGWGLPTRHRGRPLLGAAPFETGHDRGEDPDSELLRQYGVPPNQAALVEPHSRQPQQPQQQQGHDSGRQRNSDDKSKTTAAQATAASPRRTEPGPSSTRTGGATPESTPPPREFPSLPALAQLAVMSSSPFLTREQDQLFSSSSMSTAPSSPCCPSPRGDAHAHLPAVTEAEAWGSLYDPAGPSHRTSSGLDNSGDKDEDKCRDGHTNSEASNQETAKSRAVQRTNVGFQVPVQDQHSYFPDGQLSETGGGGSRIQKPPSSSLFSPPLYPSLSKLSISSLPGEYLHAAGAGDKDGSEKDWSDGAPRSDQATRETSRNPLRQQQQPQPRSHGFYPSPSSSPPPSQPSPAPLQPNARPHARLHRPAAAAPPPPTQPPLLDRRHVGHSTYVDESVARHTRRLESSLCDGRGDADAVLRANDRLKAHLRTMLDGGGRDGSAGRKKKHSR